MSFLSFAWLFLYLQFVFLFSLRPKRQGRKHPHREWAFIINDVHLDLNCISGPRCRNRTGEPREGYVELLLPVPSWSAIPPHLNDLYRNLPPFLFHLLWLMTMFSSLILNCPGLDILGDSRVDEGLLRNVFSKLRMTIFVLAICDSLTITRWGWVVFVIIMIYKVIIDTGHCKG